MPSTDLRLGTTRLICDRPACNWTHVVRNRRVPLWLWAKCPRCHRRPILTAREIIIWACVLTAAAALRRLVPHGKRVLMELHCKDPRRRKAPDAR